jgi:hypothetical protein
MINNLSVVSSGDTRHHKMQFGGNTRRQQLLHWVGLSLVMIVLWGGRAMGAPKAPVISETTLRGHMEFLASAELQGRKALEPGSRVAAKYVASEFRCYGLQPGGENGYYQSVPVETFKYQQEKSFVVLKSGNEPVRVDTLWGGKDIFLFPRSMVKSVSGEVVDCGYGIQAPEVGYDDFKGVEVQGKFVLALMGEPVSSDTSNFFGKGKPTRYAMVAVKAKLAEKLGAVGLILTSSINDREKVWQAAVERRKEDIEADIIQSVGDSEFPVVYLDPNWAAAVLGEKEADHINQPLPSKVKIKGDPPSFPPYWRSGEVMVEFGLSVAFSETVRDTVVNVIGRLEGGKSQGEQKAIVLGAHYDHLGVKDGQIYYGADDNASGVSALLAMAEALVPMQAQLRSTILFVAFGAEEEGLIGSNYYVEHPVIPLEQTVAMINMDCIGREGGASHNDLYRSFSGNEGQNLLISFYSAEYPELENLVSKVRNPDKLVLKYEPMYGRIAIGDHYSFMMHDVPVLFFFSGYHADYHTPNDRIEKIVFSKYTKIVNLIYEVVLEVGKKPIKLRIKN